MKRRTGPRQPGERYLLQCPGGLERLAEAAEPRSPGGEPVLVPLPFEDPLPAHLVPGGEWLVEANERLVRDWAGAYWSVRVRSAGPRSGAPSYVSCEVEFHRHTPQGERVAYRAFAAHPPDVLSDVQLVALLRYAWQTLQTEGAERRRRGNGAVPAALEL